MAKRKNNATRVRYTPEFKLEAVTMERLHGSA